MKFPQGCALALGMVAMTTDAARSGDLYVGRPLSASEIRALKRSERSARYDRAAGQPAIWAGLNIGLDAGYNWARGRDVNGGGSVAFDGAPVGGHLGYNWQYGSAVIGLETDLAWSSASSARSFSASDTLGFRHSYQSSYRVKGGFGFGQTLLYATGGFALAGIDADVATVAGRWRAYDHAVGWVLGGGVETKITERLGARIEVLHYEYGKTSFDTPAGDVKADLSSTTLRAGFTYYFNN